MPSLELDKNTAKYQIRSYAPGVIKINDRTYHQNLLISPSQLIVPWLATDAPTLTTEQLKVALPLEPKILLIGTGNTRYLLSTEIYGELINLDIGVEIMTTRAACLTFNALSAENRDVVAALIV